MSYFMLYIYILYYVFLSYIKQDIYLLGYHIKATAYEGEGEGEGEAEGEGEVEAAMDSFSGPRH